MLRPTTPPMPTAIEAAAATATPSPTPMASCSYQPQQVDSPLQSAAFKQPSPLDSKQQLPSPSPAAASGQTIADPDLRRLTFRSPQDLAWLKKLHELLEDTALPTTLVEALGGFLNRKQVEECLKKTGTFLEEIRRGSAHGELRGYPEKFLEAIRTYTLHEPAVYQILNVDCLSGSTRESHGKPDPKFLRSLPFARMLTKALEHLPNSMRVGRGSNPTGQEELWRFLEYEYPDFERAFPVGAVLPRYSFTSTARSEAGMRAYASGKMKEKHTIFRINPLAGYHIASFSQYGNEDEVLLPPLALFLVTSATKGTGPHPDVVKLREIEFLPSALFSSSSFHNFLGDLGGALAVRGIEISDTGEIRQAGAAAVGDEGYDVKDDEEKKEKEEESPTLGPSWEALFASCGETTKRYKKAILDWARDEEVDHEDFVKYDLVEKLVKHLSSSVDGFKIGHGCKLDTDLQCYRQQAKSLAAAAAAASTPKPSSEAASPAQSSIKAGASEDRLETVVESPRDNEARAAWPESQNGQVGQSSSAPTPSLGTSGPQTGSASGSSPPPLPPPQSPNAGCSSDGSPGGRSDGSRGSRHDKDTIKPRKGQATFTPEEVRELFPDILQLLQQKRIRRRFLPSACVDAECPQECGRKNCCYRLCPGHGGQFKNPDRPPPPDVSAAFRYHRKLEPSGGNMSFSEAEVRAMKPWLQELLQQNLVSTSHFPPNSIDQKCTKPGCPGPPFRHCCFKTHDPPFPDGVGGPMQAFPGGVSFSRDFEEPSARKADRRSSSGKRRSRRR